MQAATGRLVADELQHFQIVVTLGVRQLTSANVIIRN